jgi:polysaccharide deacetylase 2 family uncharacterized protein YibQ
VLGNDEVPAAAVSARPEKSAPVTKEPPAPPPAEKPEKPVPPAPEVQPEKSPSSGGTDILPDLEEEIRRLEAEQAAQEAPPSKPAPVAKPAPAKPAPVPQPAPAKPKPASAKPQKDTTPMLPAERRGILVFVIDDAGNSLAELAPFLKSPAPLTIAVLPALPYSKEAARRIREAKKEAFRHQPMEPVSGTDPGPGAIKAGMDYTEIRKIVGQNLDEIGPVAGLNNHEGSRATADTETMKAVLDLCRDRRIFFLDSRTTADTAAPAIAADMGFAIAQRDIFLDNDGSREAILAAIDQGCKKAQRDGLAVMIGHAWSPLLAGIIAEKYPELIKKGFYLTTISGILTAGK